MNRRDHVKKGIIRAFCIIICMCIFLSPVSVLAADEKCSLTLTYSKDDVVFSDLEIKIYLIADVELSLIEPFCDYPVDIVNIRSQTEWNNVSQTLKGYIKADGIEPCAVQITDAEGCVTFTDLDKGLYLVEGVSVEKEGSTYTFHDFMIMLPSEDDAGSDNDVVAKPKSVEATPEKGERTYTVMKLWKDDGSEVRPASVTVDIFKNAVLEETVILDSECNWSYSFVCDDPESDWTVVERNVPEGYTVTVSEKGTTFAVVNTLSEDDDTAPPQNGSDAPQTGETLPIKLFIIIFCISGMTVLVFGIGFRRRCNEKTK